MSPRRELSEQGGVGEPEPDRLRVSGLAEFAGARFTSHAHARLDRQLDSFLA